MNVVVFENVPVGELPEKWRAKLAAGAGATVTVRIEQTTQDAEEFAQDPLFGMWRERDDMADVTRHVRKLRASRFSDEEMADSDSARTGQHRARRPPPATARAPAWRSQPAPAAPAQPTAAVNRTPRAHPARSGPPRR
ncbi:MAG: hypothetical protein JNL85_15980 [Rubrivivax sp.]|nr:hypothetical protein [Rubrivivax sp.]